jgi:hypothetical protein
LARRCIPASEWGRGQSEPQDVDQHQHEHRHPRAVQPYGGPLRGHCHCHCDRSGQFVVHAFSPALQGVTLSHIVGAGSVSPYALILHTLSFSMRGRLRSVPFGGSTALSSYDSSLLWLGESALDGYALSNALNRKDAALHSLCIRSGCSTARSSAATT